MHLETQRTTLQGQISDVEIVTLYLTLTNIMLKLRHCEAKKQEDRYLGDRFIPRDVSPWFSLHPSSPRTYYRVELLINSSLSYAMIPVTLNRINMYCVPVFRNRVIVPPTSKIAAANVILSEEQIKLFSPEPNPNFGQEFDLEAAENIRILRNRMDEFINQGEYISGMTFILSIVGFISSIINRLKYELKIAQSTIDNATQSLLKANMAAVFRPSVLNALTTYLNKLSSVFIEVNSLKDKLVSSMQSKSNPATIVDSMQSNFSALSNPSSVQYSTAVNTIYDKTVKEVYNLLSIGANDKAQTLIGDVINKMSTSNGATGAQRGGNASVSGVLGSLNELSSAIRTDNPSGPSGSTNSLLGNIIPQTEPLDTSTLVLNFSAGPSGPSGSSGATVVIPGINVSGPTGAMVATGAMAATDAVVATGATGADLSGASGADLSGATGATGADLSGASGADLSGASGADLSGASVAPPVVQTRGLAPFLSVHSFFSPLLDMIRAPPKVEETPEATEEIVEPEETGEEGEEGETGETGEGENVENTGNAPMNNSSGGGKKGKAPKKRKTRRRLKVRK